jgi:hypothetical protein
MIMNAVAGIVLIGGFAMLAFLFRLRERYYTQTGYKGSTSLADGGMRSTGDTGAGGGTASCGVFGGGCAGDGSGGTC